MLRVLPLFVRQLLLGERVSVFGRDKVLDFTYVDDRVDGIARGAAELADGKQSVAQPRRITLAR